MPAKITEREVASSLAGELTNYVRRGGTPFDEVTPEPLAGRGYPDIVVWIHRSSNQAFAFWELKRPGLKEDLSKLPQKAHELGVRYVVVWNFQHGSLYEVEGTSLKLRNSYPIPVLSSLEEWHDHSKRTAAIEYAKGILEDLARLARGQALAPPDKVYFTKVLQEAIHRLQPVLQERLFEARKDKAINNRIIAWTVKQGYPLKLRDLDALLARHWAYSLAVRILFYLTVRRYYTGLPDLRPAPGSAQSLKSLLQIAFSTAQQVDWQAVFENSPLDQDIGLPPEAEPILLELLENLHRYDFSQLKEDVIGQIMEGLIPEEERHALGQYFTREDLVDFILGFVAKQDRAYYLDPTCGSGTFLIRLYSRLKWLSGYKAQHRELLERIWGVDLAHFPAELATINLFRQNVQDLSNFPRVAVRDFFTLRPGQLLAFPPLRSPGSGYTKIEIPFPKTHGIVGNFPYIRQELIERQNRGYKQQIVQAIARTWFWQDPELFQLRQIRPADLEHIRKGRPEQQEAWLEKQLQAGRIELRLSGQADIHAYLFYHAAAFLEEGGRMGIVTSNAWLDAAYGKELKRFFLRHFKIIAIVASWAEPWFEDAAVNTAFIILERCSDPTERASNVVRFVKVKKPLSELLPHDLLPSEAERWKRVDALVREIESADAQVAPPDPLTGQIPPPKDIHTVETDAFRIRLVPQAKLEAELNRKGSTAKWGLYIRAPQVYFNLLHAAGEKLVPLSQVAEVRFGIKTGINDFFYLELLPEPAEKPGTLRVRNKRGWVGEIEEDLLHPALVSLKEVKTLTLSGQESRMYLFRCRYNKKELQKRGYVKALEYINWGEQQSTTGRGRVGTFGMPFPKVASVQSHSPEWFNLDVKTPGGIISNRFIGKRFGFPINDCNFVISDNFFEILPRNFSDLYAALLNSTLSFRHSAPLSLGLRILGWKPHPTYRCTTWATWAWWPASWIR